MSAIILPAYRGTPPPGTKVNNALPISNKIVAFWPLSEGYGRRSYDACGKWPMIIVNTAKFAKVGGLPCLDMDGGTSYAVAESGGPDGGGTNTWVPWSAQFSMTAWARPTSYNNRYARVFENSVANGGISIEFDSAAGAGNQEIYAVTWNGAAATLFTRGVATSLNEWHFAAVTMDAVAFRFYLDGVLIASGTPTITAAAGVTGFMFQMGTYDTGYGSTFLGQLGPLGYWKRALSHFEVKQLYSDPYAPMRPTLSFARQGSISLPGGSAGSGSRLLLGVG